MSTPSTPGRPVVAAELLEDDTVLRLLLDRPKGNILTMEMMTALGVALEAHQDDRRLRLVFLRGAGGTFSFGAAIEEHRPDQAPAMLAAFHALVRRVAAYPVPVAALVEGPCLGGGFELTLCCHLVFAAPNARFGCPEVKLGVFPPVLAAAGAERLGAPLAERLILTGEPIDAAAALKAGFAAAVLDGDRDPETRLLEWYRRNLRDLSAFALRQATRAARVRSRLVEALGAPLDRVERQYVSELLRSHDGNEGVAAFLERRTPEWRDE